MTTETAQWAGPAHFLPPAEPIVRADGARHFSGITYAVAFGYRPLQLDLWVPDTATPASLVVYIHGGGWRFGDRRYPPEALRPNQLFDAMLESVLAVATVDYRHALEARFPAQLHDVKPGARYLRTYANELGIDVSRIGVMGESAGGHLAALVGLTADRADLDGNLDEQSMADASPITHVTSSAPPFLLVHGAADWLVPYEQSEALAAALRSAGARADLVPVDGAEHIFLGCPDIDAIVGLSVDYLADALLEKKPDV